jgi:hypothetical protein
MPPLYPKLALHISRQLTPHITVNKLTMRQVSEEFLIGALTILQDTKRKRKIRKPIEEEKEEEQLHNKILAEQIA